MHTSIGRSLEIPAIFVRNGVLFQINFGSGVLHRSGLGRPTSVVARVSRASLVQTAMRNCTRDEGRSFGFGNQVLISSHRKLLRSKAVVVSVAETPGRDSGGQRRERRAQATAA